MITFKTKLPKPFDLPKRIERLGEQRARALDGRDDDGGGIVCLHAAVEQVQRLDDPA